MSAPSAGTTRGSNGGAAWPQRSASRTQAPRYGSASSCCSESASKSSSVGAAASSSAMRRSLAPARASAHVAAAIVVAVVSMPATRISSASAVAIRSFGGAPFLSRMSKMTGSAASTLRARYER